MAKMSMEEEIKFLREEVERLKKEEALNEAEEEEFEEDMALDALVDGVHKIVVERMKEDYENMSPVTAVAIFAVGALFGRIFLSK